MENVLFKQSLRGFDRQQVLEYIDSLSKQMSQQAREYDQRQESLEKEIDSLTRQLRDKSDSLNISQKKLDRMIQELDSLKQTNAELKKQVSAYRNMILERDRQISRMKAEYNDLSRHSRQLEQDNRQWKSRQDEIAACMVEASVRAKEIINEATAQARRTKAQFDANAAHLMEKVSDMKAEIAKLEDQLEGSFARLNTAMENMDKAGLAIEQQVNSYREQIGFLDEEQPQAPEKAFSARTTGKRVQLKKSLTDSVLDTISKLLEK